MFKLQHSNTPILQHSKAHGYVPDVQLILAAMDLSSYQINANTSRDSGQLGPEKSSQIGKN